MSTYKVGDRVNTPNGEGVVCHISPYFPQIGVHHDTENRSFHDCDGNCERYKGWYYSENDLQLIQQPNKGNAPYIIRQQMKRHE